MTDRVLAAALDAVRAAGAIALRYFRADVRVMRKADRTPVTQADHEAEVAIVDNPIQGISRVNGEPSLTIAVTKTPAGNTVEGVRDYLGLDSLHYLSVDGLVEATGLGRENFCLACFNGEYPIAPDTSFTKEAFSGCGC